MAEQISHTYSHNRSYIGYCSSSSHKGYIPISAAAGHRCLEKNCPNFRPDFDHPIYKDRSYQTTKVKRKQLIGMKQLARELYRKKGDEENEDTTDTTADNGTHENG